MSKTPVILFLFGSVASSRSFQENKVLDDLNLGKDFNVVCGLRSHSKYSTRNPIYSSSVVDVKYFNGRKDSWIRHQMWVQVAMALRSRKYPAFRHKTAILMLGNLRRKAFPTHMAFCGYLLSHLFRVRNVGVIFAFVPVFGRVIERFFWSLVPANHELEALIETVRPDYLVVVSNGQEPLLAEVQKINAMRNRWVFLPDNWDNLFTKSILREMPLEFWVWGEQQRMQVHQLYDRQNPKVRLIGSSRILEKPLAQFRRGAMYAKEEGVIRILYAGKEAPHDEVKDLLIMVKTICETELFNGVSFEVTYRPHPSAKSRSKEAYKLSTVFDFLLDKQSLCSLRIDSTSSGFLPTHNAKLRNSIMHFDYVIAQPTTLLIESLAMGVMTFVVVTDDALHRSNSLSQWKVFGHFRGLDSISGLRLILDFEDLPKFLLNLSDETLNISPRQIEYFTGPLDGKYSKRVHDALISLIHNESL